MTRAETDLLITLALIVRGRASSEDQRAIDRSLNYMAAEADERAVHSAKIVGRAALGEGKEGS